MNTEALFSAICAPGRDSQVAVLFEGREITYGDLRKETVRTAEMLNAIGIEPGDRVALLLNDSPEFIASFIAVCSLGAIAVPINMGLRVDEQVLILHNCTARAAIVEADLCNTLLTDASEKLRQLREVLVVGRGGEAQPINVAGLNLTSFNAGPRKPLEVFPVPTGAQTPAFILYTSGSTGDPKGAVHRQADVFYTNQTFCAEVLRLQPGDRLFSSSRLPFAYGLGNGFSFPLLNGVTTILCREKPTPEVISRILREYKPTIFFGVPVVYNLLLDHHRHVNPLDCSSLRLCISAGEALPAHLGEEWQETFGVEVLDGIGSTEMLHMWMSNHGGDVSIRKQRQTIATGTRRVCWTEQRADARGRGRKPLGERRQRGAGLLATARQ